MTDSSEKQFDATSRGISSSYMSRETFEEWMKRLSNWGRWGPDDQLGTINLITAEKRARAASLVREGVSISLARDVTVLPEFKHHNDFELIPHSFPEEHPDCQGETWRFNYHGVQQTHLDSLAHMFYAGQLYNGYPRTTVPSQNLGVEHMKNGIVTRGVLVDIPRLRGVDFLEPGTAIYSDELDAWLGECGLVMEPGDALLIRTGRWAHRDAKGPDPHPELNLSGLDLSCAAWIKEQDVAILGCDFPNELCNAEVEQFWLNHAPFHIITITAMGLPLIDSCHLEELADEAARRSNWQFFFVATPIAVPGATGSPINPLAIF